jgi:hypothetical protein
VSDFDFFAVDGFVNGTIAIIVFVIAADFSDIVRCAWHATSVGARLFCRAFGVASTAMVVVLLDVYTGVTTCRFAAVFASDATSSIHTNLPAFAGVIARTTVSRTRFVIDTCASAKQLFSGARFSLTLAISDAL